MVLSESDQSISAIEDFQACSHGTVSVTQRLNLNYLFFLPSFFKFRIEKLKFEEKKDYIKKFKEAEG